MRVLLHHTQEREILARLEFLYNITSLFFLRSEKIGDFIVLESYPKYCIDYCMFIGHYFDIRDWIIKNLDSVYENNIVLITCKGNELVRFFSNKNKVFVSNEKNGFTDTYCGSDYGFDFDITEVELNLYNLTGSFVSKVATSFNVYGG